jgi:CheY-like chemotaxis protein
MSRNNMTGIDAVRAIKKNRATADIPIIACTAYGSGEKMAEARRAGMVDYLQKPILAALMKAKIEEFILP